MIKVTDFLSTEVFTISKIAYNHLAGAGQQICLFIQVQL